jgi:hypothetical protein
VSRFQLSLAAGVWAAAVAGTILTASDNRWFYGAFAAVFVGLAVAFVWRWGVAGRRWWAAGAIVSAVAGVSLFAANVSAESACTAKNASGQRVIIGTDFTEDGRKYHEANPNEDNYAILEALGGLGPQRAWTQASIERCRLRLILTGALWMPLFGVALTCAVGLITPSIHRSAGAPGETARARGGRKRVFISYSHEDAPVAVMVRDLLTRNNLEVTLDMDSMTAGQRIQEFIEQSIRGSEAVVSIVSNRSLLSSWVALETINSFHRQKWVEDKLFIACYLNDDFFRPEFRLECTRQIDARLETIEQLAQDYAEKKIDPVDLNDEKTRLYDLRNNLGNILATLKGSLCLDLREAKFEESGRSLVATITRS